jgi:hypothetical protein
MQLTQLCSPGQGLSSEHSSDGVQALLVVDESVVDTLVVGSVSVVLVVESLVLPVDPSVSTAPPSSPHAESENAKPTEEAKAAIFFMTSLSAS